MPVKKKKFIDKFLKVWCLPYLKINPKKILGIYLFIQMACSVSRLKANQASKQPYQARR